MVGRIVLSSFAYKRRLLSTLSSGRYYHAFSAVRSPFLVGGGRHDEEQERKDSSRFTNALPVVRVGGLSSQVRCFSASPVAGATRRERAEASARRGAKAARKGARTAGELMQMYGPVFVGTYLGIYCATLATLFGGIDSGLLDPVTVMNYFHFGQSEVAMESKSTVDMVVHMLEEYEWTKPYAATVSRNPHCANLAVAWVATKFTEPVRLLLAFGIVPRVAKWLGREVHHAKEEVEIKNVETEDASSKPGAASEPDAAKKE